MRCSPRPGRSRVGQNERRFVVINRFNIQEGEKTFSFCSLDRSRGRGLSRRCRCGLRSDVPPTGALAVCACAVQPWLIFITGSVRIPTGGTNLTAARHLCGLCEGCCMNLCAGEFFLPGEFSANLRLSHFTYSTRKLKKSVNVSPALIQYLEFFS